MSPKRFLEQFGVLANAPNGIGKLRELILQLAVRGKLVPQNPDEEPASVLMQRIAAEKNRLVKGGKTRIGKDLPPIEASKVPFDLPQESWRWTRLGEVTNYGLTQKAEPPDVDEQTWVLELEDVEKSSSRLIQRVTFAERRFKSSKNRFALGDVIYGKLRPYLDKVLVADAPGVCTTEMVPIHGYLGIVPAFLRWVMKSPYFMSYANQATHGMNLPRLGTENARLALIPLVPTREQSRIVAKVDQLMALCDELEAKQNQRKETHTRLIRAAHHPLTQPRDQAEFQTAWRRIRDNFDRLHTNVESVKALRQTILQLAVQGKLVPQDPNDEPASVLLEKIRAEKERLVAEGTIKKASLSTEPEEVPYAVPEGWEWIPLGEFGSWKGGATPSKTNPAFWNGDVPWVSPKDMKREVIDDAQDHVSGIALVEANLKEVQPDAILMVVRGMILAHSFPIAKNTRRVTINQDMKALELFLSSVGPFLQLSLKAARSRVLSYVERSSHGTCRLAMGDLNSLRISTPPIREQQRIVALAARLMTLCDELEAKVTANQVAAEHFAEATVAELAA